MCVCVCVCVYVVIYVLFSGMKLYCHFEYIYTVSLYFIQYGIYVITGTRSVQ